MDLLPMSKARHSYNSNARIDYIENYSYKYLTSDNNGTCEDEIHAVRMPVLIKSDYSVWELANIYLQSLVIEQSRGQSTLESTATALLDYLRFLEHTGLDILHLPASEPERVTYRYRAYLLRQIRKNKAQPSTANHKITKVVNFYKFCIENKLFHKDSLCNLPYEDVQKRIVFSTDIGRMGEKIVNSSNLSITVPRKHDDPDSIKDGGTLHPLTQTEQSLVMEYLEKTASREFQLMCYLALYTGARLQTVCTMRVKNIEDLLKQTPNPLDDTYSLEVGSKTNIDTKFGVSMKIKIPTELVDDIISYTRSKAWKDRAKLSYYGNNNNYVFLTAKGNSYYTSLQEVEDRIASNSMKGFKRARGVSVMAHIKQMLKKINAEGARVRPFTFHDLRATFGMNTLKATLRYNFKNDQALMYLKERMGHRFISTTMGYLEQAEFSNNVVNANSNLSKVLNQYSEK